MSEDTIVVAYAGRRLTKGGALGYAYRVAGGDDIFFGSKMHTLGGIGSTHRIVVFDDANEGRSYRKASADDYVGQADDDERTAAWIAADRADVAVRDRASGAKKKSYDRLEELLAPIQVEYAKATGPSRRAMIASVIEIITSGRSL
jgi:hypothetical protein